MSSAQSSMHTGWLLCIAWQHSTNQNSPHLGLSTVGLASPDVCAIHTSMQELDTTAPTRTAPTLD
jgi:hypothetical protein